MSDHSTGYFVSRYIEGMHERGIVDLEADPALAGRLVRLANDLIDWQMSSGNPCRDYMKDANSSEIGGELGIRYGFCHECGHPWSAEVREAQLEVDGEEPEGMGICEQCDAQPPCTWTGIGRPPP